MNETNGQAVGKPLSGEAVAVVAHYPEAAAAALERDLRAALDCPVDFGPQARALYATDASNYREVPIGIVTPATREQVIEAVRLCREHRAPIVARGGGTSLAGQGCNVAVVVDFSRFMTRVLAVDAATRTARVEPGCILDALRAEAERHHLTFGPDPATHDHNTLGGMIGNNSCGTHSLMSGRTSDYVERLTVLTYDGLVMEVGPTPPDALGAILAGGGRQAEIYRGMIALRDRYGSEIEARYPKIPRRVSGFENLDRLLPGSDFNVAQALTGTEGTCVLVLDAVLRLVPSPQCRALVLLGFDSIFDAADAVPELLPFKPIAIEGMDARLRDAERDAHLATRGIALLPDGEGWLIVECGADRIEAAEAQARKIEKAMKGRCRTRLVTGVDQQPVWDAREAALGASAQVPGKPETWPGWEDSAVAPERLGAYLRALDALIRRHGHQAAFYGHFGDGLVHCRIDFRFGSEAGIAEFRAFTREAADLVVSHGGTLSGEHGDGEARADLLERMYGPKLVRCFAEFKALWDPDGRMNPGKAIASYPRDANLRLGPGYDPPKLETFFAFQADKGHFAHATTRCVGVGKCRRRDPQDGVMCPSYLATGQEKHSTRGRAHLLHEMVRGEVIADLWKSEAVEDALSLCIACKGCKSDCPVSVDMATYKAEFRAHHYRGRRRPSSAYSMGFIHRWAQLAEPAPGLFNWIAQVPGAKWIAGIAPDAKLPKMRRSFRRWHKARGPAPAGERVLLWPDTFNDHFRPETAIAATRLLEAAGFSVALPCRPLCCGRPLYDWGLLDQAKALWEDVLATLAPDIAAGTPIVGLEPACVSAFKDELPGLFPKSETARRLATLIVPLADFVSDRLDRFPAPATGGRALLQVHCHHHAVIGFDKEQALLDRMGIAAERPPQGCCGMAGAFGFARETRPVALAIGEREILPRARSLEPGTMILADGFSCREQIEQGSGRPTLHIAELLHQRMIQQN